MNRFEIIGQLDFKEENESVIMDSFNDEFIGLVEKYNGTFIGILKPIK